MKSGNPATVFLDADPETPIKAVVREVANFPLPRRWYQAPIEYQVFVDIKDKSPQIKPGLRAKVRIEVDRLQDVVQCPSSSVLKVNERYYAVVRNGTDLEPREIEVGPNNDQFVVVHSGLEVDEEVLINPDKYKDQLNFEPSS